MGEREKGIKKEKRGGKKNTIVSLSPISLFPVLLLGCHIAVYSFPATPLLLSSMYTFTTCLTILSPLSSIPVPLLLYISSFPLFQYLPLLHSISFVHSFHIFQLTIFRAPFSPYLSPLLLQYVFHFPRSSSPLPSFPFCPCLLYPFISSFFSISPNPPPSSMTAVPEGVLISSVHNSNSPVF
jgi:hypothetical protein